MWKQQGKCRWCGLFFQDTDVIEIGHRDPQQFDEPDQFVSSRKAAGQHLAFGRGIHLCSGATLARTELRLLLEVLLSTYPPFRLDGEVVWSHMEGGHHVGVRSLPVTFHSASH